MSALNAPNTSKGGRGRVLGRLWQPRRALFWQMVLFNVLSSLCSFALRTLPLNTLGLLLVGALALLNVGFGLLAAWRLVREPDTLKDCQGAGASAASASTASTSE